VSAASTVHWEGRFLDKSDRLAYYWAVPASHSLGLVYSSTAGS
jgi:hypothetical protein